MVGEPTHPEVLKWFEEITQRVSKHSRAIDEVLRVLGKANADPALLRSTVAMLANVALAFSDLTVGELIDDVLHADISEEQIKQLAKLLEGYGFKIQECLCPQCRAEASKEHPDPAHRPS